MNINVIPEISRPIHPKIKIDINIIENTNDVKVQKEIDTNNKNMS